MHSLSGKNKQGLSRAAACSPPPHDAFVPFHRPSISAEEIAAVVETLESGWLTTGPRVRQFESAFAEMTGARHAIAVNSCTAALHLALDAAGTQKDDVVLTTPMTFAATAEVIRYFEAVPAFVDIDPLTMNISVTELASEVSRRVAAGEKVRAIIPVHFGGHPCDMEPIMQIARAHGITVIEDAAHALPASYRGKPVGSIGDMTAFSFYATKTITTGEGGMITTNSDSLAERMRIMSLHGISSNAWNRYSREGDWRYEITAAGFKYNMTDIAASLGIVQLSRAKLFRTRRESIAGRYDLAFSDVEALETPVSASDVTHSWHLYTVRLRTELLTIDRNQFIERLKEKGIGTSVHFIPLHLHPYYRDLYGYQTHDFPIAYENYLRTVSLPIFPDMSDNEVNAVTEAVREVLDSASR